MELDELLEQLTDIKNDFDSLIKSVEKFNSSDSKELRTAKFESTVKMFELVDKVSSVEIDMYNYLHEMEDKK